MAQPPQQQKPPVHQAPAKKADDNKQGAHGTKPSEDQQGANKDRHPTPKDDKSHEQGEFKDQHVPLKDPSEGKSPAVIGHNVATRDARGAREDEGPGGYGPTIGVRGLPIEDGERDPDTIAEEQRRRSAEMEQMGMAAWNAAHDELSDEERSGARQVAGAAPPPRIEGEKRIAPPPVERHP